MPPGGKASGNHPQIVPVEFTQFGLTAHGASHSVPVLAESRQKHVWAWVVQVGTQLLY